MTARWPAMMRRKTAAEYCDLSEAAFEREVIAGSLPTPISLGGRDHWLQKSLDTALLRLAGDSDVPDYRQKLRARYANA